MISHAQITCIEFLARAVGREYGRGRRSILAIGIMPLARTAPLRACTWRRRK